MPHKTRAEFDNAPVKKDWRDWVLIGLISLWAIILFICFCLIIGV